MADMEHGPRLDRPTHLVVYPQNGRIATLTSPGIACSKTGVVWFNKGKSL